MYDIPNIKMEVNIPSERFISIMQDSYGQIAKEMEKTVQETMMKFETGELKIDISDIVEETLRTSVEGVIRDTVRKVFYEQASQDGEVKKVLECLAQDTLRTAIKKLNF